LRAVPIQLLDLCDAAPLASAKKPSRLGDAKTKRQKKGAEADAPAKEASSEKTLFGIVRSRVFYQ